MNTQRQLLERALAVIVSIPIAYTFPKLIDDIKAELANPEQEPIGFISSKTIRNLKNGLAEKCIVFVEKNDSAVNPIYTSPTKQHYLDAINKIPTRTELLGGQNYKYVKLEEVMSIINNN